MPVISAGLLMYRMTHGEAEVLLGHPGGPLWARKDLGVWTIPKGLIDPGEESLAAAIREFTEETGLVPSEPYQSLGEVRQKSGKRVLAWAFHGDCDPATASSNSFELEWPPRSGRMQSFPEIDRYTFFPLSEAKAKILPYQVPLLTRLRELL